MIYVQTQTAEGIPVTIHFPKTVLQPLCPPEALSVSREAEDAAWVFKRVELQSLVLS